MDEPAPGSTESEAGVGSEPECQTRAFRKPKSPGVRVHNIDK